MLGARLPTFESRMASISCAIGSIVRSALDVASAPAASQSMRTVPSSEPILGDRDQVGFTEGSGIGIEGEKEFSIDTDGRFYKRDGRRSWALAPAPDVSPQRSERPDGPTG